MQEIEYSADVIAHVFGVSTSRMRQYVQMGMPKTGRGAYPLCASVQWVVNYWQNQASQLGAKTQKERHKLIEAQAALKKLEYEEKVGSLVSNKAVEKEAFAVARMTRDSILSVVDRTAAVLAAETDEKLVADILRDELLQALELLAGG